MTVADVRRVVQTKMTDVRNGVYEKLTERMHDGKVPVEFELLRRNDMIWSNGVELQLRQVTLTMGDDLIVKLKGSLNDCIERGFSESER